jgi:hypothetical protein
MYLKIQFKQHTIVIPLKLNKTNKIRTIKQP